MTSPVRQTMSESGVAFWKSCRNVSCLRASVENRGARDQIRSQLLGSRCHKKNSGLHSPEMSLTLFTGLVTGKITRKTTNPVANPKIQKENRSDVRQRGWLANGK